MTYCQKLQPQQPKQKEVKQEVRKQDIETTLKGDEWKKDKVTVV